MNMNYCFENPEKYIRFKKNKKVLNCNIKREVSYTLRSQHVEIKTHEVPLKEEKILEKKESQNHLEQQ